jgi:hypothetical protein
MKRCKEKFDDLCASRCQADIEQKIKIGQGQIKRFYFEYREPWFNHFSKNPFW